jgi:hypothetical protein
VRLDGDERTADVDDGDASHATGTYIPWESISLDTNGRRFVSV